MGVNIFELKPSVISRDLSGKSFFIYGPPKTGKTSNAVKFPKHLILGFEKGWNMLSNVMGLPINSWREALDAKKQLLQDARMVERGEKEETTFKTIIMDTAEIAYNMCEKFILDKEGVENLDETESKRGYKNTAKEFDTYLQELVKAGYTVVAIAHSEIRQIKKGNEKYERIQPKIDKRGGSILSGLCDVIGYAHEAEDEDGNTYMALTMRGDKYLEAGSRSRFMSEEIPFTYEALLADMQQAIDKEAEAGGLVSDTPTQVYKDQTEKRDYKIVKKEIGELGKEVAKASSKEEVTNIVEKYLGRDTDEGQSRTVASCTAAQLDMLELILSDLKDKAKELGIV